MRTTMRLPKNEGEQQDETRQTDEIDYPNRAIMVI